MTFSIEQKSGYAVVYLTGEVDLSRSPEARKAILGCLQKNENLLVDLSAVNYIDSSGIACLVEGYQVRVLGTVTVGTTVELLQAIFQIERV